MVRLTLAFALATLLVACGVNPVTGRKELQLVSTAQELAIGAQHYLPSRQAQGGDLITDPALTGYVQGVTARLAAVADRRDLPYEIVILNSSVPNAWALPGGKMAINRGLLLELQDEAELAAVLGHEIVHAAARHGARSMERGMLAQAGLAAVALGLGDKENADLIVGGATLGLALITTRYGRDAELESDRYGTEYLKRAGYDPAAAISLQETFVRLSEGRRQDWLSGLFASHPPSAERVAANRKHAARLGAGGERGRERYQTAIAGLLRTRDAYAAYDKGVAALAKDPAQALKLAETAIAGEPREALFLALKGQALQKQGKEREALAWYDRAIERNPDYYAFWLARGLTRRSLGDATGARTDLERSHALLPTTVSSEALGAYALAAGDAPAAERYFSAAAGARTPEGQRAAAGLARLVLAREPERYLDAGIELDARGRVIVVLRNRAPIAVEDVGLVLVRVGADGRTPVASERLGTDGRLAAGATARLATPITLEDARQVRELRVTVRAARPAG